MTKKNQQSSRPMSRAEALLTCFLTMALFGAGFVVGITSMLNPAAYKQPTYEDKLNEHSGLDCPTTVSPSDNG